MPNYRMSISVASNKLQPIWNTFSKKLGIIEKFNGLCSELYLNDNTFLMYNKTRYRVKMPLQAQYYCMNIKKIDFLLSMFSRILKQDPLSYLQ